MSLFLALLAHSQWAFLNTERLLSFMFNSSSTKHSLSIKWDAMAYFSSGFIRIKWVNSCRVLSTGLHMVITMDMILFLIRSIQQTIHPWFSFLNTVHVFELICDMILSGQYSHCISCSFWSRVYKICPQEVLEFFFLSPILIRLQHKILYLIAAEKLSAWKIANHIPPFHICLHKSIQ